MKQLAKQWTFLGAVALLLLSAGCATRTATYSTTKRDLVATAGFRAIPATTTRRQEILRNLPPDRVTYVRRNGRDFYVFPDPASNQLFVGMRPQYSAYRQLALQNRYPAEYVEPAQWTVATNWNVWGPWGWSGYRVGMARYY